MILYEICNITEKSYLKVIYERDFTKLILRIDSLPTLSMWMIENDEQRTIRNNEMWGEWSQERKKHGGKMESKKTKNK